MTDTEPSDSSEEHKSKVESVPLSEPVTVLSDKGVKNESKSIEDRVRRAELWMIWLTAAIVAVAVLQWSAMRGQLTAAQDAISQSDQAFRTDERAFIEIEPIKPMLFTPRDEEFGASFNYELYLKNVGKTPAREIKLSATREAVTAGIGM